MTTPPMDNVRPCPFCGESAELYAAAEQAYRAFVSCEPLERIEASVSLRIALDRINGPAADDAEAEGTDA